MEIRIPDGERARYYGASARVGGHEVRIWGDNQVGSPMGDPRILATAFLADPPAVRERMIGRILDSAGYKKSNTPGFGGIKIRESAVWDSAEGKLLTLRALMFFCRHYGVDRAYTVDRWANVLGRFDYSCPHTHYESQAAVVYYMELGESVAGNPLSGRFEFLDPRIPFCCSMRPEAPTRGLMPELIEGLMLLFPSEFIHYVHPYMGTRPRITLAFNISAGEEPEGNSVRMGERVEGVIGAVENG